MDPELPFYKYYYKYFLWNDALVKHFFKNEERDILLNIDQLLLKDIGKAIGIVCDEDNYVLDFIKTVEDFCSEYTKYLTVKKECPTTRGGREKCSQCKPCEYKRVSNRNDVLAVANHIKDLKYYKLNEEQRIQLYERRAIEQEIPFFAIIIYILLKLDNGKTQQWENVENCTTQKSRNYIIELWECIEKYDDRFDKNASLYDRSNSVYNDYIGKLLYHLPLSAHTRNKLQDAIYKSSAWKYVDTKSSWELIRLLLNSLKDNQTNKDVRSILNADNQISIRKIQAVINDFDIDAYEENLKSRHNDADYENTKISGKFALGILFPGDNSPRQNASFLLLTTVQQSGVYAPFEIREGGEGTLAGYNKSPVKINGSISVEFKEYQLGGKKKDINIEPLPFDNVIFFREHFCKPDNERLYIQTREITPAASYIIAVKKDFENEFKSWCRENDNEDVAMIGAEWIFGKEWIAFCTTEPLKGQYYKEQLKSSSEGPNETIVMTGGIRSQNKAFFINALPYFEVPEKFEIGGVKMFITLNGKELNENIGFKKYIIERKIIIDVLGMPIGSDEIASINICLEYSDEKVFDDKIEACAQPVIYNAKDLYEYNNWGVICDSQGSYYSGNEIKEKYRFENSDGLKIIKDYVEELNISDENLYFTNLLAACSYNSESLEISDFTFRKCINYAATRLDIDIEQQGFMGRTKRLLSQAGIINIDYNRNKYQVIAPTFMRVPFSVYGTPQSQMIMLCGCYTRSFVADLREYCKKRSIQIYSTKRNVNESRNEESLLPPIILLGQNFSYQDFCETCHQNCKLLEYDYALSLLSILSSIEGLGSQFSFTKYDDPIFLKLLDEPRTKVFPRLRSRDNGRRGKKWYLEREDNLFAEISADHITWASLYAHRMNDFPLVILENQTNGELRNSKVLIPSSLWLPNYVQRALYLMNLGLPKQRKVFVCNSNNNDYYTIMHEYQLNSPDRCRIFADKITGGDQSLIRYHMRPTDRDWLSKFSMHFWTDKRKRQKKYLVLENNREIVAIVSDHIVYLNDKGTYKKVSCQNSISMNQIVSFLINERWQFNIDHSCIMCSQNYGSQFEKVYDLIKEDIEIPNESIYEKSRNKNHHLSYGRPHKIREFILTRSYWGF